MRQWLRFDFYEPRHRYAVLLLWVVLDHARDVVALNQAARHGAIAIVTRSAPDAYADIANLGDHPDYWQHLAAADASKWKTLLERASQGTNPILKPLSEDEARGMIAVTAARSEELLPLRVRLRGVESIDEETERRDHQQGRQIHLSHKEICPKNRSHPSASAPRTCRRR